MNRMTWALVLVLCGCDQTYRVTGKISMSDAGVGGVDVTIVCRSGPWDAGTRPISKQWGDIKQPVTTNADGVFEKTGLGSLHPANCRLRALDRETVIVCLDSRGWFHGNSCVTGSADIDANSPVVK